VQQAARQNELAASSGGQTAIQPILSAVAGLQALPAFARAVAAAIDEDGNVMDGASEAVRATRGRVKGIVGRLNGLLKGYPGEVSERAGRMCVAVPAGG
jgi:hypothetical protein